jgi:hypothetical protein
MLASAHELFGICTPRLRGAAASVRPAPDRADADRGRAYADGCLVGKRGVASPPCVYGDAGSPTTVVLFGDSHALEYSPALIRVARARAWRLVVLTKSGCPSAGVTVINSRDDTPYAACDAWRAATLRRILGTEKPALIVLANSSGAVVVRHARPLGRAASRRALAGAYAALARRLLATGAPVVALRDPTRPRFEVPACVARWLRDLRRCAFPRRSGDPVGAALARVAGLTLLDPSTRLCPRRLCPAVIDGILVYRHAGHLTATFAATLAPWLGERLRGFARPG